MFPPSSQRFIPILYASNKRDAYEDLWHLVIPPVMTLLDDYEARYRLRGAEIVSEMLQVVPGELLRKTGVDGLIRTVRRQLNHLV